MNSRAGFRAVVGEGVLRKKEGLADLASDYAFLCWGKVGKARTSRQPEQETDIKGCQVAQRCDMLNTKRGEEAIAQEVR